MSDSRFTFAGDIKTVTAGSSVSILKLNIPKSVNAKVTGISTFIRDTAALGKVRWKLLYDGTPVLPFDNIKILLGEEGKIMDVPEDWKVFYGGGELEMVAYNDDAAIDFDAGGAIKVRFDNPVDLAYVQPVPVQVATVRGPNVWDFLGRFFE